MSNFDLTEKNGLNKAINYIKCNKFLSIYFLPYTLAYDGFNKLLSSSDKNIDQAKTVEQLIEKGKKNGVKKMTITLESSAGFNVEAPIEGVSIKASLGSKGKMTLEIEYK